MSGPAAAPPDRNLAERPVRVVLWQPRTGRIDGGHQIQFGETARALRAFGVDARVELDPDIDLDTVDIVHGCELTAPEVHRCRTAGLPVVLSTIYWDNRYGPAGLVASNSARSLVGNLRKTGRLLAAAVGDRSRLNGAALAFVPTGRAKLAAYEAADLLLPNSTGEADDIRRELGVSTPMTVVPNAVSPELFDQPGLPFSEREVVLSVARIEPHKNQLGLIRALEGTGTHLVIVGPDHPDHPQYVRECRAAGDGWVEFLGPLPHEELRDVYARARVHVLPSWYETTGLVSLEAALSGCSVVSTDRGHSREYLGDDALYCDPGDPRSIRRAVEMAYGRPPRSGLHERVLDNYTWQHTAAVTARAYRTVLDQRVGRFQQR